MYSNRGRTGRRDAELTAEELRSLQTAADAVADEARLHLSDVFAVESTVVPTPGGPRGAVSIHPPDAAPVAAGIEMDELDELADDRSRELALDLVASAVDRARTTVGDQFLPAAQ